MKRSGSSSRVVRWVVAGVAIAVLVASCGSEDGSSSTAATSVPAGDVCEDREALRSSVDDLEGIDLRAEGAEGVTDAVTAVKDDLAALRDSAGDELRPEVQAVQDAVDELETAVGNLGSGGAADAVTAASDLVSAAGDVAGFAGHHV